MGSRAFPIIVALLIGVTGCTGARTADSRSFDLVIAGGRVVDGTGAPWFRADVGIIGDRIERIGDLRAVPARQRVDATNLVVAPGFIDMLGQSEFNLLADNRAASKILQGVTTEITGEGSAIAPVNDRIIAEDLSGPATHYHVTSTGELSLTTSSVSKSTPTRQLISARSSALAASGSTC